MFSIQKSKYRMYWTLFKRNRVAMIGSSLIAIVLLAATIGPLVMPISPLSISIHDRLMAPNSTHLFGTDSYGRDILSRVLCGTRVSLLVSFSSVAFSLFLGTALGVLSGYYGGWVDEVIMRLMDILLAFPAVLLAISIIAILGPGTQNAIIAIGIVYTPIFARVARGSVLQVRQLDYVQAAIAVGASQFRIMLRHLIPNSLAPIIVETSVSLGFAILSESALSFLGLGTQPPNPSLGIMLSDGRAFISSAPWLALFPGMMIMISVLGFNLLGDGLRDIIDPKLRE